MHIYRKNVVSLISWLAATSLWLALGAPAASASCTLERKWVREEFDAAQTNGERVQALMMTIDAKCAVTASDRPAVIQAYYGALETLEAKYSHNIFSKKGILNKGLKLIDAAIALAPSDLEVHFVRFATLHQVPRIFTTQQQRREDLDFLYRGFLAKDYRLVDEAAQKKMIAFLLDSGQLSTEQLAGLRALVQGE